VHVLQVSEDGSTCIVPPPAPPLPSNIKSPVAGTAAAGSFKTKTPLKSVSDSPRKNNSPHGKPPPSPHYVQNASPVSQKREAARDRIRTGQKQLLPAVCHIILYVFMLYDL